MKQHRSSHLSFGFSVGLLGCAAALGGCSNTVRVSGGGAADFATNSDMPPLFDNVDLSDPGIDADPGPLNLCGDHDTMACIDNGFGPGDNAPFPLKSDAMPNPNEDDTGIGRDPNGYLGLDQTHAAFDFLWIANAGDWVRGTVSKIDSKKIREVARYVTVTCYSNGKAANTKMACDGTNGCCAADDNPNYLWRKNGKMGKAPPRQAIDKNSLSPSRTAIDFNGDMFVANRAFSGQSSVTKIANDLTECRDYNHNGKIDTSSDVNADGQIQTDCNNNNVLDDLDDVKMTPCRNGLKQEFFGDDDECILWTTNTNSPVQYGRPLTLGPGTVDTGPSDAWAGTFNDGKFFRIDGTSGLTKADAQGPTSAYGATTDAKNIVWIAVINDGRLGYFDAAMPANTGVTRGANGFALNAYGIALDRDQNVWQAGWTNGHAYRYTPDRSNGFKNLGMGFWTQVTSPGSGAGANGNGRGIAVDSRTANTYFAWMARDGGWVTRIDASLIPVPKGVDVMVDGSKYPAIQVAGSNTIGAGVDVEQNIWGISQSGSIATRALVDKNGVITAPVQAAPMGMNKCPAGDMCPLSDNANSTPAPYTYSDFTGFGLRNFTNPKGNYSYVIKGCLGDSTDTQWYAVNWVADVPPNTSLLVRARTGNTPVPDMSWGNWTTNFAIAPADLRLGMPLLPNDMMDGWMQVDFQFATTVKNATPKLKSFDVAFKCMKIG